ncbi:MAG: tetratricopeptide repeat protein [Bryobacter sp.]|jgi:tetratricopeptide (TPR) repeat protein|nr:tetratricopeptide repeat protein [Bryobacter sp.]
MVVRMLLPLALLSLSSVHSQQPFTETRPTAPAPLKPEAITNEMRGDIFMARKMYREALEMYRLCPQDSAITWNKIGITYHQLMDLDAARKHYEKAVKLNPKYSEALNNIGTVWYAKKNYRRATSYYQKALALAPNSASIHSNLGTAHFARKKYKEAFASYQKALELDPEVFEHRNSAGVLLQERNVEERAKFHFYLSKTYAKAGNTERALSYMRKALEEGFKDKKKFLEDGDFAILHENPEFQQLMQMEHRVL